MTTSSKLEHVNVTVSNPEATARLLCELFDWHVRWEGPSQMGGHTYHVGTDDDYVAVYTYDGEPGENGRSARIKGGLNHIGVLVDNLEKIEHRVKAAGLEPFNHMDYDPGRRFYFNDRDGIEFEVVSYV
ncbi:MAG: VOC family protein [Gammaproteobacteria bacterium]|nr:VOC family protein [Gammaproteobacteria bacterium]